MSDTPKTDSSAFSATCEKPESGDYEYEVVYADFARELERNNQQLRKELKFLRDIIESVSTDFGIEDITRIEKLLKNT